MSDNNVRKLALKILDNLDETEGYSNLVINKMVHKENLNYQDKRFISNLVYGVIENRVYLDFIIRHFSSIRLKKIQNSTLNALRMGVYQIIFLDKVPDSAAVNESVKLVKKVNPRSSGFANGILRSVIRERDNLPAPDRDKDEIEYLSVKYSHTRWIVEKFVADFGVEFAEELMKSNNNKPVMNIRVNTLKATRSDLLAMLEGRGFKVRPSKYNNSGIVVESFNASIVDLDLFNDGFFTIQDSGSMLISEILAPKPGETVLDVCAAPGGKTTHLAQLMDNKGSIIARDIYGHKLDLVKKAAERLGITIIETHGHDGTVYIKDDEKKYDKILLDAPCSGFGIIRRKPEIKYTKTPEDIKNLASLQLSLLKANSSYLKVGGEMVYSTCSINKEENQDVIKTFLSEFKDFELVDISSEIDAMGVKDGMVTLYPNVNETDGFFICKLRRNN